MLSQVISNKQGKVAGVALVGAALIALLLGADPSAAVRYHP